MNRRTFLKALAALASASAIPAFASPVLESSSVQELIAKSAYVVAWSRAYDLSRDCHVFQLTVKFNDAHYMVNVFCDSPELDSETKRQMERELSRLVMKERGIALEGLNT